MELTYLPLAAAGALQNMPDTALLKWRNIFLYGYDLPATTSQSSSGIAQNMPFISIIIVIAIIIRPRDCFLTNMLEEEEEEVNE